MEEVKNLVDDSIVKETVDALDLTRTGEMFDSLITRSKVNDKTRGIDEDERKNIHMTIRSGNLHVKTAGAKITAIRLSGYRSNMEQLKLAVERRAKDANRPTGEAAK